MELNDGKKEVSEATHLTVIDDGTILTNNAAICIHIIHEFVCLAKWKDWGVSISP